MRHCRNGRRMNQGERVCSEMHAAASTSGSYDREVATSPGHVSRVLALSVTHAVPPRRRGASSRSGSPPPAASSTATSGRGSFADGPPPLSIDLADEAAPEHPGPLERLPRRHSRSAR